MPSLTMCTWLSCLQSGNADDDAVKTLQRTDAAVIMLGTQSEEVVYAKTAALHVSHWGARAFLSACTQLILPPQPLRSGSLVTNSRPP